MLVLLIMALGAQEAPPVFFTLAPPPRPQTALTAWLKCGDDYLYASRQQAEAASSKVEKALNACREKEKGEVAELAGTMRQHGLSKERALAQIPGAMIKLRKTYREKMLKIAATYQSYEAAATDPAPAAAPVPLPVHHVASELPRQIVEHMRYVDIARKLAPKMATQPVLNLAASLDKSEPHLGQYWRAHPDRRQAFVDKVSAASVAAFDGYLTDALPRVGQRLEEYFHQHYSQSELEEIERFMRMPAFTRILDANAHAMVGDAWPVEDVPMTADQIVAMTQTYQKPAVKKFQADFPVIFSLVAKESAELYKANASVMLAEIHRTLEPALRAEFAAADAAQ